MRRAANQVLRIARRPTNRSHSRLHKARGGLPPHARNGNILISSSMYFRNFSVALVSTIVASSAYYATRGGNSTDAGSASSSMPGSKKTYGMSFVPPGSSSYSNLQVPTPASTTEATRKALFIDQGQLYTGTISGDAPLSKSTDDHGRKVLEMMTPEQATERIRRNEQSYHVGRGKGVVRYDVVQLASNDPIEDDHAEKIIEVPQNITPASSEGSNNDWMFWGVFDGHSGWTTSAKLRQALISYVARELNSTYSSARNASAPSQLPTPSSIDAAIKRGFIALDTSIVQDSVAEVLKAQSKTKAASLLAPALSGSCALLSFYDSASKNLRVACTGDSRAILGRRNPSDSAEWIAVPLSEDQTGGTPSEMARLRAEHPGEPNVVSRGRILGSLEPSRAFGDATYKWSKETQDRMKREYFGRSSNPQLLTPPYVTAEPVISTTRVQPETGDFVVMATDGLWEMLTNEEVVGLVGAWLAQHPDALSQRAAPAPQKPSASWLRSWFAQGAGTLPVREAPDSQAAGQRAPLRQQQWGIPADTTTGVSAERFVVEDKNVATHLIRNALGGRDKDMMCALLTLPSPFSRRYRDDLTVEVIFFGEEGKGNGVSVNEEASAGFKEEVKAKL